MDKNSFIVGLLISQQEIQMDADLISDGLTSIGLITKRGLDHHQLVTQIQTISEFSVTFRNRLHVPYVDLVSKFNTDEKMTNDVVIFVSTPIPIPISTNIHYINVRESNNINSSVTVQLMPV